MPRKLSARVGLAGLVAASGCFFSADYRGHYTCTDNACPSGLVCSATKVCVPPADASGADADAPIIDGPPAALICADPGPFPPAGGTAMGTTAGRTSTVAATCAATIQNGPDAVYRVHLAAAATIMLTVSGSFPVDAYVIAPCAPVPATPACIDNVAASAASPVSVFAPAAGDYFIVVDGINAGLSGTYTLGVAIN